MVYSLLPNELKLNKNKDMKVELLANNQCNVLLKIRK